MATVSAVADSPSALAISTRTSGAIAILTVDGTVDTSGPAALRDAIVEANRSQPSAVIIDLNALRVDTASAWPILLAARWQGDVRPDVPIVLVCGDRAIRETITRSGVTVFMPIYASEAGAKKAVARLTRRDFRYAQMQLPATLASLRESRRLVREWLTDWSQPRLIPVALVVVNVFLENVLEHTGSDPLVRIECDGSTATIAVSDDSGAPAARLPSPAKGIDVSGLAIVAALSRAWGSTPTLSGKTVWAVIGPENQL